MALSIMGTIYHFCEACIVVTSLSAANGLFLGARTRTQT